MYAELVDRLVAATSADELEAAITHVQAIHDGHVTSWNTMDIEKATSVFDGVTYETTSKLRRRIRRFLESIATVGSTAKPLVLPSSSSSFPPSSSSSCGPMSISESIQRLRDCTSVRDVETTMNALAVPSDDDAAADKEQLKAALRAVLSRDHITNKALRRRIARFVFVLCDETEKAAEKKAAKARAEANSLKATTRKRRIPDETAPVAVAIDRKPAVSAAEAEGLLTAFLALLGDAKSSSDVEAATATLPPAMGIGAVSPKLVASVQSKLAAVIDDSTLVNNAKLRRRVKRLFETFDEAPQPEQPLRDVPPSKVTRREVAVAVAVAEPQLAAQRPKVVSTGSFSCSFALLVTATEPAEVELALNDLSVDSEGTDAEKIAFRRRLHSTLENSSESSLISNAKVRRRAKRLLEMLEAKFPASEDKEEDKPAAKQQKKVKPPKYAIDADPNNPPAGPPLDAVLEHTKRVIEKATGVEEWSTILDDVTADSGNCGSRRSLKRLLERVVDDDSLLSAISVTTKRRVADVISFLAPKPKS